MAKVKPIQVDSGAKVAKGRRASSQSKQRQGVVTEDAGGFSATGSVSASYGVRVSLMPRLKGEEKDLRGVSSSGETFKVFRLEPVDQQYELQLDEALPFDGPAGAAIHTAANNSVNVLKDELGPEPPIKLEAILCFLSKDIRNDALGDLNPDFKETAEKFGIRFATFCYLLKVVGICIDQLWGWVVKRGLLRAIASISAESKASKKSTRARK